MSGSTGSAAASGAVSGAAAGAALGPWGALAGAAIGAGMGYLGAKQASNQAAGANTGASQMSALLAQRQYELMLQQLMREREIANYYQQQNTTNNALALDQRDYERRLAAFNFGQATQEQDYYRDRQRYLDQAAAERRAFDLEQLLRNQNLSREERAFAIEQLSEAQAVARGERAFGESQLALNQGIRAGEAAYGRGLQDRALTQAEYERGISIDDRNRVLGRTAEMRDRLDTLYADMGDPVPFRRYTEDDVTGERDRRSGEYQRSIDRAVDRIASQAEAGLIRSGVDQSTVGETARGQVAARAASLYEDAYRRAADDALRYITGMQQQEIQGAQGELQTRGGVLSEAASVYGAPLQYEARLPELRSGIGPYYNVPSAAWVQDIGSANNYRAPVAIGSGIYDRALDQGIGQTIPITSARWEPARSSGINPAFLQLPYSQAGIFSNGASELLGRSAYADMQNQMFYQRRADDAWKEFGQGSRRLFEYGVDALGRTDWNSMFGSNPSTASVGASPYPGGPVSLPSLSGYRY